MFYARSNFFLFPLSLSLAFPAPATLETEEIYRVNEAKDLFHVLESEKIHLSIWLMDFKYCDEIYLKDSVSRLIGMALRKRVNN